MSDERLRSIDQHILSTVWTSNAAYQNLLYLCDDLGPRFAGSPAEHQAAAFLQTTLAAYGLDPVWREPFPIASWERGPGTLELVSPLRRSVPVIALPYCPSAELEAELVDVGEGELADFERLGATIQGTIVLTDAETNKPGERRAHRMDKYNWARARGARALIFSNRNPGMLRISGRIVGRNPNQPGAANWEAPIPGLGISYEAGETIRRLAKRGPARLRISTQNRTYDSVSYNVIGEITGSRWPDEVVLFGGHYDGHDISQGARDDAAGALVGIEAARALAGVKGQLDRTIRVICFGAEEVGLRGAWHHAASYDDGGHQLRFMLNLDGAGRGPAGQEEINVSGLPELADYFAAASAELPYEIGITSDLTSRSDHFPFAVRGIPNATLSTRDKPILLGRGWDHTEADTVDKLSLGDMQSAAALTARLVVRLANADPFPSQQRSVDEIRQQLTDAGILGQVEHAGRFPPRSRLNQ